MIVSALVRFGYSKGMESWRHRLTHRIWNSRLLAKLQWLDAVLQHGPSGPAKLRAEKLALLRRVLGKTDADD